MALTILGKEGGKIGDLGWFSSITEDKGREGVKIEQEWVTLLMDGPNTLFLSCLYVRHCIQLYTMECIIVAREGIMMFKGHYLFPFL